MRRALLVNWDCYPNVTTGGVYTWEKILVESMNDWEFVVFNMLSNSAANGSYKVPKNVVDVIELPLFGSYRYDEFLRRNQKSQLGKAWRTSRGVIEKQFLPLFREFLSLITADDCREGEISSSIVKLHEFFAVYDSKKCLEDPSAWESFLDLLSNDPIYMEMRLSEASQVFQLLQRSMQILSVEIPPVDIVHCALAWTPALVAIVAKMRTGCKMIVSEHGVAFKELLLYYNADTRDGATKVLMKVLAANIVKTIYWAADIVAPVCTANVEWERKLGVEQAKIRVIYNGIDSERFRPMPAAARKEKDRPTVVFVGRIDIFKDVISLLTAMSRVRAAIPEVLCLIYGTSIDLDYSLECLKTVDELGLGKNVRFMGGTKEPEKAYNSGDVVVASSITEGFPFAVIEAMACGKPVVATDVGGVREALGDCGLLVRSRSPDALAKSMVTLLRDQGLRERMGTAARERVLEKFTLSSSVRSYTKMYEEILTLPMRKQPGPEAPRVAVVR